MQKRHCDLCSLEEVLKNKMVSQSIQAFCGNKLYTYYWKLNIFYYFFFKQGSVLMVFLEDLGIEVVCKQKIQGKIIYLSMWVLYEFAIGFVWRKKWRSEVQRLSLFLDLEWYSNVYKQQALYSPTRPNFSRDHSLAQRWRNLIKNTSDFVCVIRILEAHPMNINRLKV